MIPKKSSTHPGILADAESYVGHKLLPAHTDVPDPDASRATAAAFTEMRHDPTHPAVKASYDALKREISAQWDHLKKRGVTFTPWTKPGQPYATSADMARDARDNRHLHYFPSEGGFGGTDAASQTHPLLEKDHDGIPFNDKFRAVHDYFGHALHGHQFGPTGEYRAYLEHAQMFSPEARGALTSETHGQNSWVNFGPHSHLPVTERPYAEQKAGLLDAKHWPPLKLSAGGPGGMNTIMWKPGVPPPKAPKALGSSLMYSHHVTYSKGGTQAKQRIVVSKYGPEQLKKKLTDAGYAVLALRPAEAHERTQKKSRTIDDVGKLARYDGAAPDPVRLLRQHLFRVASTPGHRFHGLSVGDTARLMIREGGNGFPHVELLSKHLGVKPDAVEVALRHLGDTGTSLGPKSTQIKLARITAASISGDSIHPAFRGTALAYHLVKLAAHARERYGTKSNALLRQIRGVLAGKTSVNLKPFGDSGANPFAAVGRYLKQYGRSAVPEELHGYADKFKWTTSDRRHDLDRRMYDLIHERSGGDHGKTDGMIREAFRKLSVADDATKRAFTERLRKHLPGELPGDHHSELLNSLGRLRGYAIDRETVAAGGGKTGKGNVNWRDWFDHAANPFAHKAADPMRLSRIVSGG